MIGQSTIETIVKDSNGEIQDISILRSGLGFVTHVEEQLNEVGELIAVIQHFQYYTEEELAAIKAEEEKNKKEQNFILNGPDRLTTVEVTTDDLAVAMADFMLQTMSV